MKERCLEYYYGVCLDQGRSIPKDIAAEIVNKMMILGLYETDEALGRTLFYSSTSIREIRKCMQGGSRLSPEHVEKFLAKHHDIDVVDLYSKFDKRIKHKIVECSSAQVAEKKRHFMRP